MVEEAKKDDVKKPESEQSSEATEKSNSAEYQSDFSELEELEGEVAKEDAKSESVEGDSKDSEVSKEDEKKKGEGTDENEDDTGFTSEVKDMLDEIEDRSIENVEGETKRKVEQAVENVDKSKLPMSEEELEEMVARDYPGMGIEEFKRNMKFQKDYYDQIVKPDLAAKADKDKAEVSHHDAIKRIKGYKALKPAIDKLLKDDPAIKLLPPEHRFKHAMKLAIVQEYPKMVGRKAKKVEMQNADKKAVLPASQIASSPKSSSKHSMKLGAEERAYMEKRGLTEDDLNDPNLSGTTVIEDD